MTVAPLPLFHRELTRHELVFRTVTVAEVSRVAPDLVRLTLAGDELEGWASEGATDHVKVFFPNQATGEIATRESGNPADVIARDFTPLPRQTAEGLVVDIDFYTHADPGPASSFAMNAKVGDTLVFGGPRGSRSVPAGANRFIIIADETALPAASRWVKDVSGYAEVVVIATVSGDGTWVQSYVGERASVVVTTNDADAAIAALTAVGVTETTFVFVAGNAAVLVPIRRHVRRVLQLPTPQVSLSGYWRSGVVAWDHHAPIDPTDMTDDSE